MSLNTKVIMNFLAGLFAALFAWWTIETFHLSGNAASGSFYQVFAQQALVGSLFGLCVGTALGLVSGFSRGSTRNVLVNTGWGAVVGILGGLLGLYFGQMFFGALYKNPGGVSTLNPFGPLIFIWDLVVRAIGWALIGFFIGLAQGLPSKSKKAARHGAIGGLIGGFVGGSLFEVVPYILPPGIRDPGVISRGIGLTVTGAAIGLFIGLVELLLKQAWIRVVQGRNEGKEYVITKPQTTIGRSELSDIGLFGDHDVAPTHAVLNLQNGRYVVRDAGAPVGTSVNNQRVTEQALRDGDVIQIGSMRLEFREKATQSLISPPVDRVKPQIVIPQMDGICPFCGTKKNPITGECACTVGVQAPVQQPQQPPAPQQPSYQPSASPTISTTAVPPGHGARLTGTGGQYAGQQFSIKPLGPTTVGREPDRDIQLSMDSTVSRRHARLEYDGGAVVVTDEGSSNGTAVNGMPVTRHQLAPGDEVSFGSSSFRFDE